MSSTANRVIKNTGYLYAKMGITMFVSLYTTRLILNSLGASDFGIFNIVGGAIAMLGFLNAAMASATQRFMSYSEGEGNKEKQKSIFNVSIVLHLLISFVVGLALLIAGYFFFHGILNIPSDRVGAAQVVYGSLIVSTMFTVMTVPYDAVLNAHENMKYYAIVGIIESFLKLLVAFACVYTSSDKLIVYGILMACIPLVTLFIMRVYCHKHYSECHIAVRTYWDKGLMKEMTGFAGWNFLSIATASLTQQGVSVLLNHFFGTLLNAAQGVANQLCGQLQALTNTMLKALNPVIAKSEGGGNRELMLKVSLMGCKYSYLILIVLMIPPLLEMSYIMKLWLGDEPPLWATLFCRLQIIRTMIEQLFITFSTTINAQGEIAGYTKIKCTFNILPLFLTYLFFHCGLPPYWMYISWIFCWSIVGSLVSLVYVKTKCGLAYKTFIKEVILPCMIITILCLLVSGMFTLIFSEGFLRLLIVLLSSFVVLIITSWLIALKSVEREIIRTFFNKKWN